jgi:predicted nucleotidyltransferase
MENPVGAKKLGGVTVNSIEKAVLEKFQSLLSKRVRVNRITLFGSRARGNADPDSDMDVLVILDEPITTEAREAVSDCAWEAGIDNLVVVVPVVYSRDEWEEGPEQSSLLALAVKKEGIAIYERRAY